MRVLALGVLTGTGLFLEIALTRLLSVLYFPPVVFTVITLAVLGIGLGAALAAWRQSLRGQRWLALYTALAGIAAGFVAFLATIPFNIITQGLLFGALALPFFFSGMIVSSLFAHTPGQSPRLYMADLVGAGIGVLLVIPVMNTVGALNAVILAAVGFGLSGILLQDEGFPLLPVAVAVVGMLAGSGLIGGDFLQLDVAQLPTEKPILEPLRGPGSVLETRWDAFARTDVIDPGDGGPLQLFVDGAAGSIMPPGDAQALVFNDIGFFPFATSQPARVLVIGPGGGFDVSFGLRAGSQQIDAIEVNPASVDLVRDYAAYNGGLYDNAAVTVTVDEGRSALQRTDARYDLIFLAQVITETAERTGYALTENSVYTVEAFDLYLDHLLPDGQLALKLYDEPTLTRALSTVLAALRTRGLTDQEALQHTAVFIDPAVSPPLPLLLVGESAYTRDDALALGAVAREVGFVPLYLPGALAQPPLDAVESGSMSFDEVIAASPINIRPPTDNRPFFFQFERGIPAALVPLLLTVALVAVLGTGLLVFTLRKEDSRPLRWLPAYFACLGVGFIVVEVALIQQTRLFLGHPTLAVSTVIAVLLVGGGVGSWLSGRLLVSVPLRVPVGPALAVVGVVAAWAVIWPLLNNGFIGVRLPIRVIIVSLSLLPVALLMGVPFPIGLRALDTNRSGFVALAWAVNGVATVAGSVGAVTVSILLGFQAVLLMGALFYTAAAAFAWWVRRLSP